MTTLTARSINEVFIEKPKRPVLITVTFHGGDNMIGWPWGDTGNLTLCSFNLACLICSSDCTQRLTLPANPLRLVDTNLVNCLCACAAHGKRSKSPDQTSMELIGSRMRDWAGRVRGAEGKYKVGTMTDAIYAVQGGMEDWAYGASWEKRIAVNCDSKVSYCTLP